MHRSLLQYLDDILNSLERIQNYTQGITFQEFSSDPMRIDAVIRNFEIIGEAVKQLPPELKERYPGSDWKRIAGFRDILSHAYFSISPAIVWDIVQNHLPALGSTVRAVLHEQERKTDS